MTYREALEYLEKLDLVIYYDPDFQAAVDRAEDALRDCLELGLTGEP